MSIAAISLERRHRFSVAEFERMGEAGVVASDARLELVEGELIDMAPIGSRHAGTVDDLARRLWSAVGNKALVRVQNPLVLDDLTEVQPDLALLVPRGDFYRDGHPRPADVLLLIEVAEASLRYDREVKLPLYAQAGIPEVWLVDLAAPALLILRAPDGKRYRETTALASPGALAAVRLPALAIELAGLFAG